MSDQIVQRTPEEIDAAVEKARAEAAKAQAEADKARHEARSAEIDADEKVEKRTKALAQDEYHFIYRFSGSVDAGSVTTCINKLNQWSRQHPGCEFEIIFTSPGGNIIEGFRLFDNLQHFRSLGHKVTTGALGMAASMAGVLLQAGDVRWVGEQSWVLIHRASFGVQGSAFDVEDQLKFVERLEKRIIGIFTSRSDLTAQKIKRNWDRKDWWLSSDEALELGVVDEVRGKMPEKRDA